MNYVDVASIDAAIEKATKLGAQVALPKTPIPGVGAVAAIIDPQRNICGLWEQKKAVATANELTKTGAGDPCGMHGRPPCRQRIRR